VASVYTFLFVASLSPVVSLSGGPHFPGPWESSGTIAAYFQGHSTAVLICAFLQFGAAIPLGIFTATMVSRLHFLGVRAAGAHIALFGGLMSAFNMAAAALVLWVIAYPGIAQETGVLRPLYYLAFSFVWLIAAGFALPKNLHRQKFFPRDCGYIKKGPRKCRYHRLRHNLGWITQLDFTYREVKHESGR
jgi:hypothetical protein